MDELLNLPDVDFVEDTELEDLHEQMKKDYSDYWAELHDGQEPTLDRGDPITIILYACAVQIYQMLEYIDMTGKMDFLKYAYDEYLDNLAALKGITRIQAQPAKVTVRFTLSEARSSAVSIPEGTRVEGQELYFETDEYAEVPIGATYADVECTCQTAGAIGNEIAAGDIDTLVDVLPYIASVASIEASYGGTDLEEDEALAERAYLAPASYSVAGPEDAYKYWAKTYDPNIGDVYVGSSSPGVVTVTFVMADGTIPTEAERNGLAAYLMNENIRPLTDTVSVIAPDEVSFDVAVTYYINASDSASVETIKSEVEDAVEEYIAWQSEKIGRDLNPSKLTALMLEAGAKRVVISEPEFTTLDVTEIAALGEKTVTYGGIEND